MSYRTRNSVLLLIALLLFSGLALPPAAASATIQNIPGTRHSAPVGTSLATISAAIRFAANQQGWIITEETPGLMQASLRVRTHVAMVTIGFDESNYWIEYRDSVNLDYNPNDRKKTKSMRLIKGPRIHKNYNLWVSQLSESIADHVKAPPQSHSASAAPPLSPILIADELEKLDSLRERGILTQEEFDQQKAKLLAQ
jgi:hypothetical protein